MRTADKKVVMDQKKMIVVAMKASKEVPKAAMEWTLAHLVQPGTTVMLLIITTPPPFGKKVWGLQRFTTDCATGLWRSRSGTFFDLEDDISDSCSEWMHQLCEDQKQCKINVKIKILSGSIVGVVAAEAKREQTDWVILDKKLKNEAKHCMEYLQCNVVMMKGSHPKVLRLNLMGSHDVAPELISSLSSTKRVAHDDGTYGLLDLIKVPNVTPSSSPEHETSYTATDARTSSMSSSEAGASTFSVSCTVEELRKEFSSLPQEADKFGNSDSDTDDESMRSDNFFTPWIKSRRSNVSFINHAPKSTDQILKRASRNLKKRFSLPGVLLSHRLNLNSSSVRDAISLSKDSPAAPPPLCSKCQHKTPVFGKPPHSFTYTELEMATDGFSESNFLAEGGFGSVYWGVLPDGQVIAVKQYKVASTQGDSEFCSEVEVLSCAQHRNVVMLIGFCVDGGRRLLVYEYVCNRSLDHHLYGRSSNPLDWSARQKIAVGSARGLRYLHEECRVGCIVHRDMRPNNILVTHDFEPLVGDFGLARCQPDGGIREETRVIGTFGYLAPEYAQSGQITEKADVYSFGIVLLELITGRKAVDMNRPKGELCLTEWARRLLKEEDIRKLIDPHLGDSYVEQEICSMLRCASLCIRKNPDLRPRMSQVLQILEGGF